MTCNGISDREEANRLPVQDGLDISRLSVAFRDTNTSYKFLWALALLRICASKDESVGEISLRNLAAGMLDAARRPFYVFRLRSRKDDRVPELFRQLENSPRWDTRILARRRGDVFLTRSDEIPQSIVDTLTNYVSRLFLTPFFSERIGGLAGTPRFETIRILTSKHFCDKSPPPYRFTDNGNAIVIHSRWKGYIRDNASILKSWILWHWARYMQRTNPSIPALISKLDEEVMSITRKQRNFWRRVLESERMDCVCIYSGEKILVEKFALDHYIPWSFVAHDEMWNLVPVSIRGNELKSDNLPKNSTYFESFVQMQMFSIRQLHDAYDKSRWEGLFESYSVDLNLNVMERVPTCAALRNALASAVGPLMSLAANQGFSENWTFPKSR